MSQFDILSVGDVVTDASVKLRDDNVFAREDDKGNKWLIMPFATKIPYDAVDVVPAVGNASNAAVSFARLGLRTGFVTNIGGDQEGRDIIASLHKDGVDTRFVRVNPGKKTNYHYVLRYKGERTILIKHEDYAYHWPHLHPAETPRWLYFSSISEHALPFHDQLAAWLERFPDIRLAFQPGTYQLQAGAQRLRAVYERTDVLILNREEAALVGGGKRGDIDNLFNHLHKLGPRTVVITDGPDGAYASDGQNRYSMPLYPDPAPPVDRTGAGDAFASTLVAALAKGLDLEEALRWAPINSMSVVQTVGTQEGLLSEQHLLRWLHRAPAGYVAKRLRS